MLVIDVFLSYKFGDVFDIIKLRIFLTADYESIVQFIQLYLTVDPNYACMIFVFLCMFLIFSSRFKRYIIAIKDFWTKIFENSIVVFSIVSSASLLAIIAILNFSVLQVIALLIYVSPIGRSTNILYNSISGLASASRAITSFANNDEQIVSLDNNPSYVVFILGESMDRNALMCYGNNHANTPNMNASVANGNAILFNDVIAPANNTTDAQKFIWTFAEKGNETEWYKYENLIDVMRLAGYQTNWLSNQSPMSLYGNEDNILSHRADNSFFW